MTSAVFSPKGTRIVTVGQDSTAKVWDTTSGQLLFTLSSHTNVVASVIFSPDGTRIVTASADNTAKIWDSASGHLLTTLTGHNSDVANAVFSLVGTRIVTASADRTARIWLANTEDFLALARTRVTRQLTATERQVYGLDPLPYAARTPEVPTPTL